ncbi:hypothetical protein [Archangium lansingense]|uniref:Uncharacterized protein n=1 Tax=Archangium lansingense TaxID=2995310 RepID=A0ABT4AAK2_9BACT|nr:hypothetical protein [Archangium lansinium]MCY1078596.1 hypothetical protein [Archangium lansinium]
MVMMFDLASVRVFVFWGFVPLVVPFIATGLGSGENRVDRFFYGSCAALEFLLLNFLPRRDLSPGLALAATLAFSGVVAMVYLALARSARRSWMGLLVVLGVVDVAALVAVYLSMVLSTGVLGFLLLLVLTTLVVESGGVWMVRRMGRARDAKKG